MARKAGKKRNVRKPRRTNWKALAQEQGEELARLRERAARFEAVQSIADGLWPFLEEQVRGLAEEVVDEKIQDATVTF